MHESVPNGPRLVVGVDFSETSGCAVREARRLGAVFRIRITLIHVLASPGIVPWTPGREAIAWLGRLSVATGEIEVRSGRPWAELARAAEEQETIGVVVGSHGVSGYQPLTLGLTASRLTLLAPCPVIIVSPRSVEAADRRRRPQSQRAPLTP